MLAYLLVFCILAEAVPTNNDYNNAVERLAIRQRVVADRVSRMVRAESFGVGAERKKRTSGDDDEPDYAAIELQLTNLQKVMLTQRKLMIDLQTFISEQQKVMLDLQQRMISLATNMGDQQSLMIDLQDQLSSQQKLMIDLQQELFEEDLEDIDDNDDRDDVNTDPYRPAKWRAEKWYSDLEEYPRTRSNRRSNRGSRNDDQDAQATEEDKCLPDWTFYPPNQCFWFSEVDDDNKVSWTKARHKCKQLAPNLKTNIASMHDNATYSFLQEEAARYEYDPWVGLNDRQRRGHYVWEDGTPTDHVLWHPDNIEDYIISEGCAVLQDGYLHDKPCNWERPYICRYTVED